MKWYEHPWIGLVVFCIGISFLIMLVLNESKDRKSLPQPQQEANAQILSRLVSLEMSLKGISTSDSVCTHNSVDSLAIRIMADNEKTRQLIRGLSGQTSKVKSDLLELLRGIENNQAMRK